MEINDEFEIYVQLRRKITIEFNNRFKLSASYQFGNNCHLRGCKENERQCASDRADFYKDPEVSPKLSFILISSHTEP